MDQATLGIAIAIAKKMVSEMNEFSYSTCTTAADTPYGVSFVQDGVTITGTLVASASTMHNIYLVPQSNGGNNYFDEYITIENDGTYAWEKFGSTEFVQQALVCQEVNHVMRITLE